MMAFNGSSIAYLTPPAVGPGVVAYGAVSAPFYNPAQLNGNNMLGVGSGPNRGPTLRAVTFSYENTEVLAALVKLTGPGFRLRPGRVAAVDQGVVQPQPEARPPGPPALSRVLPTVRALIDPRRSSLPGDEPERDSCPAGAAEDDPRDSPAARGPRSSRGDVACPASIRSLRLAIAPSIRLEVPVEPARDASAAEARASEAASRRSERTLRVL